MHVVDINTFISHDLPEPLLNTRYLAALLSKPSTCSLSAIFSANALASRSHRSEKTTKHSDLFTYLRHKVSCSFLLTSCALSAITANPSAFFISSNLLEYICISISISISISSTGIGDGSRGARGGAGGGGPPPPPPPPPTWQSSKALGQWPMLRGSRLLVLVVHSYN